MLKKLPKVKPSTRTEALRVLRSLRRILGRRDRTAEQLWNLLSAMRSADFIDLDGAVKDMTTARIRSFLVPTGAGLGFVRDTPLSAAERSALGELPKRTQLANAYHFWGHYLCAVDAVRYFFGYDLNVERRVGKKGNG